MSSAVNLLSRKPLRPGALDVFAQRDPMGSGFVCRVDLFDGLRELGVSGTPPQQASNNGAPMLMRASALVHSFLVNQRPAHL